MFEDGPEKDQEKEKSKKVEKPKHVSRIKNPWRLGERRVQN